MTKLQQVSLQKLQASGWSLQKDSAEGVDIIRVSRESIDLATILPDGRITQISRAFYPEGSK